MESEEMMDNFSESGHHVFRASRAINRGTLRGKGGGRLPIHYCAEMVTVELIFRTIISVNRFSIYGRVSDWCGEVAQRISDCSLVSTGQPVVKD